MILDSNIFIYAILPEYSMLRNWCFEQKISASDITRLEVLGYHNLSELDKQDLSEIFTITNIYPISSKVITKAIKLRQSRKMSVGDAVIAATALEYKEMLATHNLKDFDWIDDLKVIDPFLELG
ncbi:PilT protein-like protein [Desulfamplus magnetovallimortis]|uniref:PilT protein-like protein n=1 Tax=Desulfamplus magnetovallimortis TaxID=1246637 RepID=A0A1W1H8M0_9BACT|nr:type II toxin-antitoxin system VapC family toxin [Desulfamplus magnetovallimortis]SLM28812.1 PilT protein-like protein [Desulfamplus magnetovallimortis]